MQSTLTLITTENLGKRFNREWIFRKFNYEFQAGTTYAVTGPNGSGKSTLMQVLWGQLPPSSGKLTYQHAHGELEHDQVYRGLTIAAPYMDLIEEFTLLEQTSFHFKLKSPRHNMSVDEIIDRMNLSSSKNKYIGNFSSGMKQRVKLALAFFTQADFIFLDEPGTNLDKNAFQWYTQELKKLPASLTVFIASNNPNEYQGEVKIINILDYK